VAGSLSGEVVGYDLATRQEIWSAWPLQSSVAFAMTTSGTEVYVPYVTGQIVALDARDGHQLWRLGDHGEGFRWPPVVAGPTMVLSGAFGGVVALNHGESQ
jgi:outer membrane protein assembly factor BamB